MLLQMVVGLSGPAYTLNPSDKKDFPEAEAVRLIAAGIAIPVVEDKIERTVKDPIIEKRSDVLHLPERKTKGGQR